MPGMLDAAWCIMVHGAWCMDTYRIPGIAYSVYRISYRLYSYYDGHNNPIVVRPRGMNELKVY